ncbi:ArsR/SmtB family transcription factor [Sinanaerobacter chloroacetimidivorans]|uniref:Winged helix-turn-helix transcriptional regulator n=1 Tax=Sinanaerobacter chloroacetimidivorans TaxID=2818044 RepID=A0A8J7W0J2_9FIRM|nr:metalloregulator ArsR/SmtB family transcription factor [Sinanaerobacter chloroacetimidivorans]MBR0598559.1 winged helix-turn-helix transcriptional regulator [Sinanaerobacter chloroacetimidivorans]
MSENLYKDYSLMFKALSDETRLRIVEMLCSKEMCACKILESFNITQPTLSYHMKILTECGLVDSKREGALMNYSIIKEKINILMEFLSDIKGKCL